MKTKSWKWISCNKRAIQLRKCKKFRKLCWVMWNRNNRNKNQKQNLKRIFWMDRHYVLQRRRKWNSLMMLIRRKWLPSSKPGSLSNPPSIITLVNKILWLQKIVMLHLWLKKRRVYHENWPTANTNISTTTVLTKRIFMGSICQH